MKRLFGYEPGGNDRWRHLVKDGELDQNACDRLLDEYIPDDEVVVFADRQHALQCRRSEASKYIAEFMTIGDVRVANVTFSSKVKISNIGAGQGFRRLTWGLAVPDWMSALGRNPSYTGRQQSAVSVFHFARVCLTGLRSLQQHCCRHQ